MPEPKTEFRIFRRGRNASSKGDWYFTKRSQKLVIDEYEASGIRLHLDVDHAVLDSRAGIEKSAAHGWFDLSVRNGELWAVNVKWQPGMAKMLSSGDYKYFSPAFMAEENEKGQQEITSLLNVSVTNIPSLRRVSPLAASKLRHELNRLGKEMTDEDKMQEEEKLAEDMPSDGLMSSMMAMKDMLADESVPVEERLTAAQEAVEAVIAALETEPEEKPAEEEQTLADDGEEEDDDDEEKLSQSLTALSAASPSEDDTKRVMRAFEKLSKTVVELKQEAARREVEQLVEQLTFSGHVTPAQRDWALKQSVENLKEFAKSAPKLVPASNKELFKNVKQLTVHDEANVDDVVLTEAEENTCNRYGVNDARARKLYALENRRLDVQAFDKI